MPHSPTSLRPFGRAEDLDIAFTQADRPALVTALLARCSGADDPSCWWAQPVGARIEALLRILALTEGVDRLAMQLRCTQPGCGETFEVALPIDALPVHEAGPLRVELPQGRVAVMRQATGDDLRRWRAAPPPPAKATAALIDALRVDGDVQPADGPALAEAIAAHDPLVAFHVACTCPACGADDEQPVDLEDLVLQRLAARQQRLLRDVHELASHYGWAEAQILAVPPARRARYLALIGEAA